MKVHVGVDIVVVARVSEQIASLGQAFVDRVWTAAEVAHCGPRVDSLAARWAAKEAVLKALGGDIAEIPLTEIEVRLRNGSPVLGVTGSAARLARDLAITDWSVSMSHDGGMAIAMVTGVSLI